MDDAGAVLQQQLIELTKQFLQQSGSGRAAGSVTLQSDLEKELGVGSLEKAELFHRIEEHFDCKLPEALLAEAKTLQDIQSVLSHLSTGGVINPNKFGKLTTTASVVDPSKVDTLIDVIQLYADMEPNRPYLYLQQEESEEVVTYGQLFERSQQVAAGLAALGVAVGDTVAIMLPTSCDFFYAFYGTLLAGATPVPIYPPMRINQIEEYANKEATILFNAGVKVLISFKQAHRLSKLLQPFVPSLLAVTHVENLLLAKKPIPKIEVDDEDIALLQYTSGSTGNPKGVVLTHKNLLANIRAYGEVIQPRPDDVVVSWLPLYHDMGLIGVVFGCLYFGMPLVLMSPLSFLSRPENWLWTIHYRRGTLSAAPNFAYELCAKKIPEKALQGLDLSCWRLAFNGAEAIYPRTLREFTRKFSSYGFADNAFVPSYGLAESSVALAFPPAGRPVRVDKIDRAEFEEKQIASPAGPGKLSHLEFVCCGAAIKQHEIQVVDAGGGVLPERHVGSIQFRGPSSMQGYYRNSDATLAIYHQGWWDSGDLGYLVDGEIYVTGRKKDVIIKAGRNYYAPEIEDAACDAPGVRKGCVAAFGVVDKKSGTEKIVVVVEKKQKTDLSDEKITATISENISAKIGAIPDDVVLVMPRTIPKTSSGKLRRASCKQMYLEKALFDKTKAVSLQVASLFVRGLWRKIKRVIKNSTKIFYTAYMISVGFISFFPMRLMVAMVNEDRANKIVRYWSKFLIKASFCPFQIKGVEYLKKNQPAVFVCNHTSYVDVILLMSVLPTNTRFIAKKELAAYPLLGGLLKKLGHIFIDRMDVSKSTSDLGLIHQEIEKGRSILFFPEGTFTRVAGVRPFKLGPYKVAAQSGLPVQPLAISNARAMLRASQFLFSLQSLALTIFPEKQVESEDWKDLVDARDWSRALIASHCGEGSIDLIVAGPEGILNKDGRSH